MIFLIAFLIWFYHVPALQGMEEDEIEFRESVTRHQEEISFECGKDSFLRLQQKYETDKGNIPNVQQ